MLLLLRSSSLKSWVFFIYNKNEISFCRSQMSLKKFYIFGEGRLLVKITWTPSSWVKIIKYLWSLVFDRVAKKNSLLFFRPYLTFTHSLVHQLIHEIAQEFVNNSNSRNGHYFTSYWTVLSCVSNGIFITHEKFRSQEFVSWIFDDWFEQNSKMTPKKNETIVILFSRLVWCMITNYLISTKSSVEWCWIKIHWK